MRTLATLTAMVLTFGCNYITPFDPDDQPLSPNDGEDSDDGGPDSATDATVECEPSCDGQSCGPDGCGGLCGSGCPEGELCLACAPDDDCREAFFCGPPAANQWVYVRRGSPFLVGSPGNEVGRDDDELQREVTLTHDFIILSTEFAQGDMDLAAGRNPSFFSSMGDGEDCGPTCPVENILWHEAANAANHLSNLAGLDFCYVECSTSGCDLAPELEAPHDCTGYRLPTEAEWELAARAGSSTATYSGDLQPSQLGCEEPNDVLDGLSWFCGNSNSSTNPVAQKEPNAWGLYDMLGNVAEWCQDFYVERPDAADAVDPFGPAQGTLRVVRGGAWDDPAESSRAAHRRGVPPDERDFIGFRLVRTVNQH